MAHKDSLKLAFYVSKAVVGVYLTGQLTTASLAGESWWTACDGLGLVLGKLRAGKRTRRHPASGRKKNLDERKDPKHQNRQTPSVFKLYINTLACLP